MYIRYLDEINEHQWEKFFVEECGLNFNDYWSNRVILTRKILEEKIDWFIECLEFLREQILAQELQNNVIFEKVDWVSSLDDIYIGYQILGVLILQTGSFLPDKVKSSIMVSTSWEYDKSREWDSKSIESRKYHLNRFRNKIKNHRPGKRYISFIRYND